jgi:hypothetical protein
MPGNGLDNLETNIVPGAFVRGTWITEANDDADGACHTFVFAPEKSHACCVVDKKRPGPPSEAPVLS